MQLICIHLHGQYFELYHEVCYISLFLFESFNLSFGICCLCLVTECCLDFFDEILPILGSEFFIQLIELSLYIQICYISFEVSQNCCDPVIGFYNLVVLEEQSDISPLVFEFCLVTVKPSWVQYYALRHYCLYILVACAGVPNISVFAGLYLFEASSVICKDLSCSNNASISFILLELILVSLCSFHYTCFISNR